MPEFHEFLIDRLERGGFSTEDTLASFLPLLRQVIDEHNAGFVAPLEGLENLRVDGVRIWFEDAKRLEPKTNSRELARINPRKNSGAVEIIGRSNRTTDVDEGIEKVVDLSIGKRDEPVTRQVYLPGYVAWEHQLGHHDPVTDTFSLGLILASLACGLDLSTPKDLEVFVSHRENLFVLNPDLHPVLAQAIVRMTELDRHQRPQDLPAVLHNLDGYRDQEIDFEFDLARIPGFNEKDVETKQQVVLSKLRERLFEISKRNRLLHFRGSMNNVNLTHSSIPLSFDVENVRPDQILVWNKSFTDALLAGKPIPLNKYLNFAEALYLPSVLDRIISEARRDQAEFGFAQLRIVACFFHWANLKEKPIERFESPLILLPVKLTKKKGIRDTYYLECVDTDAEVNPVIRHQFKQLYDIDLPESIDLTTSDLDKFYDYLSARIAASESAVTLQKIDRPRIQLIHDKARRKLDQYRRRARIAGRGVRTFMDLDYSYDPANYHPLGIKLFTSRIRPSDTHLRSIIEKKPRPRSFMVENPDPPAVEKEQTFFSVKEGGEDNPYTWSFDLCSVTLANFKYRKMSLVRDYESLLDHPINNPAFDATFSLVPRPVSREVPTAAPLSDRFDVVPCDPTQASAIEEAHEGKSYIIQGPPGTGKSQTITNLIADHVARGKRVLFVCEKRAAIDVVFARLRQVGLGDLCSLIHDSQTDKKNFVMDLKQSYETYLKDSSDSSSSADDSRHALLSRLNADLKPLQQFDASMNESHEQVGIPVHELVERCVQKRDEVPELSAIEKEKLPNYATWDSYRETINNYAETLREIQRDAVLANHPLYCLSPRLARIDRPLELVAGVISRTQAYFEQISNALSESTIERNSWQTIEQLKSLVNYSKSVMPLAEISQLRLVDENHPASVSFDSEMRKLGNKIVEVEEARTKNKAWKKKLPPDEASLALEQAKLLQTAFLPWLRPAWWRLRSVLNQCYDFKSHVICPTWLQVLSSLENEFELERGVEKYKREIAAQLDTSVDVEQIADSVARFRKEFAGMSEALADVHQMLLAAESPIEIIRTINRAKEPLDSLLADVSKIVDDPDAYDLEKLKGNLATVNDAVDDLPDYLHCLAELADIPQDLSKAIRTMPLTPPQVEAAVAANSLEEVYRADRQLNRFSGLSRNRYSRRLEQLYDEWLDANAQEIRERAKRRFLEHIHICNLPASQLSAEQKEFKKRYNRGRRELEHEFGKSMRYKSIRDLVADESGEVIKDLKPVWLMSPLSVSDTLPLDTNQVDVVIFDEASQITLEESVPSLFRATQAIVVGDEMQLPPTDFFSSKRSDEEELLIEENGELVQYDLESNSFLNHAAKNLQSTMLGWHYRSRSESLISFSNWVFYDGRLLTVPEEQLALSNRPPLIAEQPDDGETNADELLRRPISFHFMEHGVYENRRNRSEAEYIAHLVRRLLVQKTGVTIGIVAFSEAQQDEIENALNRLAQQDSTFRGLLEAEFEREDDDQFVGLLVKNLENIQGDERDVIILSICYGHGPTGKMLMNFGPINKSGGEKRLNVAFSRAKHHMAVVSSIRSTEITNEYNDGANCLKNYLRYSEAVSIGDQEASARVLQSMSPWHRDDASDNKDNAIHHVANQLTVALEGKGYQVDQGVGQSHFRCNLAVRKQDESSYCLGILLDDEEYYQQSDLLERDVMRPRLLRHFGWKVAVVLSKDWLEDPEAVVERLTILIENDPELDEEDEPFEEELSESDPGEVPDDESGNDKLHEPETPEPEAEKISDRQAKPLAPFTRYFEFTDDKSNKFWEISFLDASHTVRFGKIGTDGQTRVKSFDEPNLALQDANRLIREKLKKGYVEKTDDRA